MREKVKVPAIRFDGFTDAWEQRKLGEVCAVSSGVMGDSLLTEGQYHLTRIETIADGVVDEKKVGYSNQKPNESYRLNAGDILYSNINSISHMGKVAKYQCNSVLYHGINLLRLRPSVDVDSDFLLYLLNTESRRNWAKAHANQAVSQASINQSLLESQEIMICKEGEQIQIGTLFRRLDHLITLHQRKYSRLCNVKKSMLEKMFPKNGASVPEIRFAGFTGGWERCKLGEIAIEIKRNDPDSEAPIMMITAENGFIEQSKRYAFNNAGESLKKYILLQKGELAYNHGASKIRPFGSCFSLTTVESARVPFVYHCFSVGRNNSEFVSIELNGKEIENQLRQIVSSGARMDGLLNISYDEYCGITLRLPETAEQYKISEFFRRLDHLLTLHQRELKRLQNIKKSCLEKMFV